MQLTRQGTTLEKLCEAAVSLQGKAILCKFVMNATCAGLAMIGRVECEMPNRQIHTFSGTIRLDNDSSLCFDNDNFLLRGSQLHRCQWCIGLVTYTGQQSKVLRQHRQLEVLAYACVSGDDE